MLWAYVDDEGVILEEWHCCLHDMSLGVEVVACCCLGVLLVVECVSVLCLEVFQEWVSLEVAAQEEAAHIGMSEEYDAVEVVDLTLEEVGAFP